MIIFYFNENLYITSVLTDFYPVAQANLENITIRQKQIWDIIKDLGVNKAHGPDDISGRVIKPFGLKIAL